MSNIDNPHLASSEAAENDNTPTPVAAAADAADDADGLLKSLAPAGKEEDKNATQPALLMRLTNHCRLFHSPEGKGYISIPVRKHTETYAVHSVETKNWLRKEFYRAYRKPVTDTVLDTALQTLEAEAICEGREIPVHLRIAEHDGAIYLDLANDEWKVIKITPSGWQVQNESPVRFRRTKGMAPLPLPQRGGSVQDELRPFLNISDPESWKLLTGWLVGAMRPKGPYPVLEVHGPQGAAKSTACRVIRSVIDPNNTPLRSKPRSEQEVFIQANNGWVCSFDNLSAISEELSDTFCRISTGGGFSARELYSNDGEIVINAMRPIIFNGIGPLATRGDLLDRTITISVNAISDEERREEESFWCDFEKARPAVIGALLDAVSCAMRNVGSVKLKKKPRMADFCMWVTAAEPALQWRPESFVQAYTKNREGVHERVLEADPVAMLVLEHVDAEHGRWRGSASDLRQHLLTDADGYRVKVPESASALSSRLNRLEPTLLHFGVRVEFHREGRQGTRIIELSRVESTVSPVGGVSSSAEGEGKRN